MGFRAIAALYVCFSNLFHKRMLTMSTAKQNTNNLHDLLVLVERKLSFLKCTV